MRMLYALIALGILLVALKMSYFQQGFQNSTSVVVCKASWCGHCKTAQPEFDKLSAASPITLPNGGQATVKILDADTDKDEISKYSVRGYPTILITNGSGTPTEYQGERTYSGVMDFLKSL